MDLGRADPRFGTFGKVLDRGPFEVCRRMTDADLWLGEEDAGGNHASQEGEEWRICTRRGGAHLRCEDEQEQERGKLLCI